MSARKRVGVGGAQGVYLDIKQRQINKNTPGNHCMRVLFDKRIVGKCNSIGLGLNPRWRFLLERSARSGTRT
jgi:hypothetical protein